jgi:hypothetical protein
LKLKNEPPPRGGGQMLELKAGGMRPTDIAKALKTGEPYLAQ